MRSGEEEERRVGRGWSGDEEGKGEEEGGEEEEREQDGWRERRNGCSSKRDLDFPGEGRFERS